MVFFTCNNCGESVKKQAVEKHYYTKCRGVAKNVSCMDCQKDFLGESFVAHTKCISEAEKYSGKDYVHKESANSNGRKQEDWMDIVRSILDTKEYNLDAKIREAFERLKNMNNVPRKKVKFINFANNCLRLYKPVTEKVWKVLEQELEKMKAAKAEETAKRKEAQTSGKKEKQENNEKTTENGNEEEEDSAEEPPKKKKKKADSTETNGVSEEVNGLTVETNGVSKKKKKKKAKTEEEVTEEIKENLIEPVETNETMDLENSEEFQWSAVIEKLVAKHPEGITLNKLQKKLLKKYLAKLALETLTEKQQKKFEKRFSKNLNKSPAIQVDGELVKPC